MNYKDAGGYLVVVLIVFCIFGLVIFGYNVRAQTITATGATGSTVDEGSKDITGTTAIEMPVTIYGCAHIPSTPSFFGEVCKVYDPQTQKRWIVVLGDRGMALAPN